MFTSAAKNREFFERVTAQPVAMLAAALLVVAICGAGLTHLVKDTSVKAFIPAGHQSLIADRNAAEIFGLSDTIAVAVLTTDQQSVFTPDTLALIADITDAISQLENIRADRVASLATESSISGADGAVFVDPYIDPYALDDGSAESSRARWERMAPHHGTLVSDDARGAAIMAELIDAAAADRTYGQLRELAAHYDRPGIDIHVAGSGAVSGYLSEYIDRDARKLQPLVFVVVLAFIYFAFRRAAALPGPLLVVLGSAAGAIGLMAWAGVPYYAITNALPVIVVAISVADSIHILSTYYQMREESPDAGRQTLVIRAMAAMVRPITLTTITTIAGFSGIALVSIMPPITWFAIFASVGVALAWLFSIIVLPNVLLVVDPGRSPAFLSWRDHRPSRMGRLLAAIGTVSPLRYRSVLAAFTALTVIAIIGAMELRIDRSQVENFAPGEAIRVADEVITARFAGTAFLDIIVETDERDGLLRADRMQKIVELQYFFETLPNVQKTVSIADYVSLLHRAIEGLPPHGKLLRELPENDDVLAETLFLHEMSGDPSDFEEEIDVENRRALVRGVLNTHYYSENRVVVERLQDYIRDSFNEPGMTATLTGDVNVSYHWMQTLKASHFKGVACSLFLVLAASVVVFRSIAAGLVAVVPVLFTILILYACMGFLDIYLEPATSMFAAIALGVGVDFAIHLVDRLRSAVDECGSIGPAIDKALPPVARACFFNSAALGVGFSVLLVSDLPTLMRFGGLVTLSALTSFIAALVFVPAIFAAEQAWLGSGFRIRGTTTVAAGILFAVAVSALPTGVAHATDNNAMRIARAVAERPEGKALRRTIDMTLTNRRGRSEQRTAIVHKLTLDERRLTRITFEQPARWRGRAFLSHDYIDEALPDERWMFLPARKTVRTIPASERGDAFLGTDFSYADIQSELKFDLADWDFEFRGEERRGRQRLFLLAGTPKTERIARELRYGSFEAVIDAESWMPIHIDFADRRGRLLKTVEVTDVERIDGIWTPRRIVASNHQTAHRSRFEFRDIAYLDTLPDTLFSHHGLGRRLPATGEVR